MRKLIQFLLTVALLVNLCGCDLLWSRYTDYENDFSVTLPRFWEKQKNYQGVVTLAVLAPLSGAKDKFRENVNINSRELDEPETLEVFFEVNKEEILRVFPGVKSEVGEGEIAAGKIKGRWLRFKSSLPEITFRVLTSAWMKDMRVYVITCTAEDKEFPKYEPYFRKIIRSFRIR